MNDESRATDDTDQRPKTVSADGGRRIIGRRTAPNPWSSTCTPILSCLQIQAEAWRLIAESGAQRAKSLFRNILRVSGLNSKIWRDIICKLLIPKDRDRGGGVSLLVDD